MSLHEYNGHWLDPTHQHIHHRSNTGVDIYCYRSTAGASECDDVILAKN